MSNQINTVIVLRNDQTTNWEKSSYVMLPGEVGIGYLTRTDKNGNEIKNVIAKLGDGVNSWADLPQIEGVFENDLTLTYNFGRHTTSNGFVVAPAKGMTTSQWLIDALSVTKEPAITYPNVTANTATFTPSSGEAGTTITKINWTNTFSDGSYEFGSSENAKANSSANTSAKSWEIKIGDTVIGTAEDGSADYSSKMTDSAVKVTVSSTATINAAGAYTPLNNVGTATSGKITGFDKSGTTTKTVTKEASVTGYRKPFWGVLAAGEALDTSALTSAAIRGLASSGTSTAGLPSSIDVPVGSQMVIIAAKSGTKNTLVAKDSKAMNAEVGFTKVAKAVKVEGANSYTAVDYDVWYVDWNPDKTPGYTGIGSAKKLELTWS
jgi:hypothetical protein